MLHITYEYTSLSTIISSDKDGQTADKCNSLPTNSFQYKNASKQNNLKDKTKVSHAASLQQPSNKGKNCIANT